MSPLFVLGAPDPEMSAIETLARQAGAGVIYAEAAGRRVHPGNAYAAESPVPEAGQVWVECAPAAGGRAALEAAGCLRVDHHAQGDPGFGSSPAEFLAASSLGQVLSLLAKDGWPGQYQPLEWTHHFDRRDLDVTGQGVALAPGSFFRAAFEGPGEVWALRLPSRDRGEGDWEAIGVIAPADLVLAAAADHCLAAAYRGECPGVDPDKLARWRAESRAAFQKRPVLDLLADWERAAEVIEVAPRIFFEDGDEATAVADLREPFCRFCGWTGVQLEDELCPALLDEDGIQLSDGHKIPQERRWEYTHIITAGGTVPEAVEGSLLAGIPVFAQVRERDGREKVVLLGATSPELIRAFLVGPLGTMGLNDPYGDPERGYAGAYLP